MIQPEITIDELLNLRFDNWEELGMPIDKFNGAFRYDVLVDPKLKLARSPGTLFHILNYITRQFGQSLSYGLKSRKSYVPFLLGESCGVFYFEQRKVMNIPQLIKIERAITEFSLTRAFIFAINFSIPVKNAIIKYNGCGEIIKLHYIDSVLKIIYSLT